MGSLLSLTLKLRSRFHFCVPLIFFPLTKEGDLNQNFLDPNTPPLLPLGCSLLPECWKFARGLKLTLMLLLRGDSFGLYLSIFCRHNRRVLSTFLTVPDTIASFSFDPSLIFLLSLLGITFQALKDDIGVMGHSPPTDV